MLITLKLAESLQNYTGNDRQAGLTLDRKAGDFKRLKNGKFELPPAKTVETKSIVWQKAREVLVANPKV